MLPDTGEHFPLGHEHFDCWAAAMVQTQSSNCSITDIIIESKNDYDSSRAIVDKPPNHCLFHVKKLSLSPVLPRHLDMQSKVSAPTQASAPVFNFTIGNELASLFHPQVTLPVPPATQSISAPFEENGLLIPSGHATGPDMPIIYFCLAYQLDDSIAKKFVSHSLKEAHLLQFVWFADLKEMGFKFREIAALHDAIKKWSIPAV